MTVLCEFEILGTPAPQGSKRAFKDKGGNVRMSESNALGHAAWRNAVTKAAADAWGPRPRDPGPVAVNVTFVFQMPKSRPREDRLRGWCYRTVDPDVDKLLRPVLDALQAAGVVRSDSQVVSVCGLKRETVDGWVGAHVTVERAE